MAQRLEGLRPARPAHDSVKKGKNGDVPHFLHRVHAVILDVDGSLVDAHAKAFQEAFAEAGFERHLLKCRL